MEGVIENNSHYERTKRKYLNMVDTVLGENGHDNSEGRKLFKIWGMLLYSNNKNSPLFF